MAARTHAVGGGGGATFISVVFLASPLSFLVFSFLTFLVAGPTAAAAATPNGEYTFSLRGLHACASLGGYGYCWGSQGEDVLHVQMPTFACANATGDIGSGVGSMTALEPLPLFDPADGDVGTVSSMRAGWFSSCGISSGGAARCFGAQRQRSNFYQTSTGNPIGGQVLGIGDDDVGRVFPTTLARADITNVPLVVFSSASAAYDASPSARVVDSSISPMAACHVFADGSLRCSGRNYFGLMGIDVTHGSSAGVIGDTRVSMGRVPAGIQFKGSPAIAKVSVGFRDACAISTTGELFCWGMRSAIYADGIQTIDRGDGSNQALNLFDPLNAHYAGGSVAATDVDVGFRDTMCAVFANGQLYCSGYCKRSALEGYATSGLCGAGHNEYTHPFPDTVTTVPPIPFANTTGQPPVQVSVGAVHACALFDTGGGSRGMRCWGGDEGIRGAAAPIGDDPGEMAALPFTDLGTTLVPQSVHVGVHVTCVVFAPADGHGPRHKCEHGHYTSPAQVSAVVAEQNVTLDTIANMPFRPIGFPTPISLSPMAAPATGGTVVTVNHVGYMGTESQRMFFNTSDQSQSTAVNATWVSPSSFQATTPAWSAIPVGIRSDAIHVGYSAEGISVNPPQWIVFRMYHEPTVSSVVPRSGPETGGTRITLRGPDLEYSAWMAASPRCCINGVPVPGAAGVATWIPDAIPPTGRFECDTVAVPAGVSTYSPIPVTVAFNGVTCPGPGFASVFHYYNTSLLAFGPSSPRSAPVRGGTQMTMSLPGSGYVDYGDTPRVKYVQVDAGQPDVVGSVVAGARPGVPFTTPDVTGHYSLSDNSVTARVRWAPNGVDYVDVGTVVLYGEVEILATQPAGSPLNGTSEPLLITGIAFADTGEARGKLFFPAAGASVTFPAAYVGAGDFSVELPRFDEANKTYAGQAQLSIALNGVDFAPTSVFQFPYFRMDNLLPAAGPATGGTVVTVSGDGFILAGPDLTCRFGSTKVVDAVFVSANQILCPAPALPVGDTVLEVTTNGKDYSSSLLAFTGYVNPTISAANPVSAPTTVSGTTVTLFGIGFPHTLPQPPTCEFGGASVVTGAWRSETTAECPVPPGSGQMFVTLYPNGKDLAQGRVLFNYYTITSLSPSVGPATGGTRIAVAGAGFVAGVAHQCRFGTLPPQPAEYASPVQLVCISPERTAQPLQTSVPVTVSALPSGEPSDGTAKFMYHTDVTVVGVEPGAGTSAGGAVITVNVTTENGAPVPIGSAPACVIAGRSVPAAIVPSSAAVAGADGFARPIATTVALGNTTSVVYEPLRYVCTTPPGIGSSPVDLAVNGRDSARGLARFVYVSADGTVPTVIPTAGGSPITVTGNGFELSTRSGGQQIVCEVAGVELPARVVDDLTLVCEGAPAASAAVPPRSIGDQALLRVSVNGRLDYSTAPPMKYYEHPQVSAFSPTTGPSSGGTVITVYGARLIGTESAEACRVGDRDGVHAPDPSGADFVAYCTTPRGAGAVPLRFSLNSVDFVDATQPGLTLGDPATLFGFYSIISVSPRVGPIAGGTVIEISGSGFTNLPGRAIECRVGGRVASAVFISEASLLCTVPTLTRRGGAEVVDGRRHRDRRGFESLGLLPAEPVEVNVGSVGWSSAQSAVGMFSFYEEITVASVWPRSGPAAGGQEVTIKGTNFFNETTGLFARFGAGNVVPAVYVSESEMRCVSPAVVESVVVLSVSHNGRDWISVAGAENALKQIQEGGGQTATTTSSSNNGTMSSTSTSTSTTTSTSTSTATDPEGLFRFLACPVGEYAEVYTDACLPCPLGTYNAELGSTSCKRCSDVSYADAEGMTACTPCPGNTKVPIGVDPTSIKTCQCMSGFFHPTVTDGGEPCIECPTGAVCDGEGAVPVPAPGFWTSEDDPLKFLDCRGMGSQGCEGIAAGRCAFPYKGRLCGDCEDGYYATGSTCNKCTSWAPLILVAFVALCILLVSMVVTMNSGTAGGRLGGAVAIVIATMQMIAVIGELPVGWDPRILAALDMISLPFTLSINAAMVECAIPGFSYRSKYLAQLALPMLFAFLFGIAWVVMRVHHNVFKKNAHLRRSERVLSRWERFSIPVDMRVAKDRLVASALMLFNLTYMFLVRGALQHFDCTLKADGVWSLDAWPSRSCYEPWWWQMLAIAVCATVFYAFFVPGVLIVFMSRNKGRMRVPRFARRYGSFYRSYAPEHCLREAWNFSEKCAVALIAVFLNAYVAFQLAAILAVLSMSLVSHETFKPYWNDRDNHLQTCLRWCVLCYVGVAVLVNAGDYPSSAQVDFATVFVIIFFAILGVIGSVTVAVVVDDAISLRAGHSSETLQLLEVYLSKVTHPQAYTLLMRFLGSGMCSEREHIAMLRGFRRCARCAADPSLRGEKGSRVLPSVSPEEEARVLGFVDNMLHRTLAPAVVPCVARWLVLTAPALLDRLADVDEFMAKAEAATSLTAEGAEEARKAARRIRRERLRRRGPGLARTGAAAQFEPPTSAEMVDALCLVGFALAFERHQERTRTTTWFSYLRRHNAGRAIPLHGAPLGKPVVWDPLHVVRMEPGDNTEDKTYDVGANNNGNNGNNKNSAGKAKANAKAAREMEDLGGNAAHDDDADADDGDGGPEQHPALLGRIGPLEEVAFLFETLYGYGPIACSRLAETVTRGPIKVLGGLPDPGSGGKPTALAARGPLHSMSRLQLITTPDPMSRSFAIRAARTLLGGAVREGRDEEVEEILAEMDAWRQRQNERLRAEREGYAIDSDDGGSENGGSGAKRGNGGVVDDSASADMHPADWVTASAGGKDSADSAPPPLVPSGNKVNPVVSPENRAWGKTTTTTTTTTTTNNKGAATTTAANAAQGKSSAQDQLSSRSYYGGYSTDDDGGGAEMLASPRKFANNR